MEPTKAHPKLCINPLRVTKSYIFLVPDTSKLQHYNNGKMHNKFPDNVNFSIFHWFKHFMLVPKEHRLWCRNQVQTSPLAKTKQDWKNGNRVPSRSNLFRQHRRGDVKKYLGRSCGHSVNSWAQCQALFW